MHSCTSLLAAHQEGQSSCLYSLHLKHLPLLIGTASALMAVGIQEKQKVKGKWENWLAQGNQTCTLLFWERASHRN